MRIDIFDHKTIIALKLIFNKTLKFIFTWDFQNTEMENSK